jgi:hypothetical protein
LLPQTDIWRAAVALVKRYSAYAMLEAAERADQLLEDRDPVAAAILDAIERLQAKAPAGLHRVQGVGGYRQDRPAASAGAVPQGLSGAVHGRGATRVVRSYQRTKKTPPLSERGLVIESPRCSPES